MLNSKYLVILAILLVGCLSSSQYRGVVAASNNSYIRFNLTYTGSDSYYVKPTSPILKSLIFQIHTYTFNDFSFKITDPQRTRFQIPQGGVFPQDPLANFSFPLNLADVTFSYTLNPFDFKITRKGTNATIFSTYQIKMIFSEFYLQIGTEVDSMFLYGIGERFSSSFRKGNGKWTVFNRDRGQVIDKGQGLQTYGHLPVYLIRERNNFFHINYLRNSNAMDLVIQTVGAKTFVTYKVIGGVLDFRFLLAEQNPETAIEKLGVYLGRSQVPPFWALGAHQCRWGYKNVSYLQQVISKYEENELPLDTIWSDIDYMVDYEDFTIDESRFPLDRMSKILSNYHYIPIIDAGIKINDGVAYTEGKKRGVFVKDAVGNELVGKVWPGNTTFVDFFHPNASQYWRDMLNILYTKVQFSGVWLDMNEIANFCDGPCSTPTDKGFDYSNDLPYQPGSDGIQSHTISLNATHYGSRKQADVHAFTGFLETASTNQFLRDKGKRPFIITRSNTLGSNKYGFHWTGDNYADFEYLKGSIADNFNHQIWGMQMVGPDICGFGGDTNQELCSRWYQLASLYPFHRNHNDLNSKSQQPYAQGITVLNAASQGLFLRYALLKHYYSIFINKRGLGSIFKPLFFAFPLDNNLYLDEIADTQFMVGLDLMAAPILESGKLGRRVYFPREANWYDAYTGQYFKNGTTYEIDNVKPIDPLPLYVRSGSGFLPNLVVQTIKNTDSLNNRFALVAGFNKDPRRSNSTHSIYEAVAGALSIQNYNDEARVSACLINGCEYIFNLVLTVTSNTRVLEVNINYVGAVNYNQLLYIDLLQIMYEEQTAISRLENPIEVRGTGKIVIPINGNANNQPHFLIKPNKTIKQNLVIDN